MVVNRAYVKVEWTTGAAALKEMTELVEQEVSGNAYFLGRRHCKSTET